MSKVTCLFMYKNVISVLYVDDCLFWACSKSDIDNVMNYFKEDSTSYNWEHSKVESLSEFLFINIKTLDYGGSQFFQTGLICKFLEATGVDNCNWLSTPTKFKAPLEIDVNGSEVNRDWPN